MQVRSESKTKRPTAELRPLPAAATATLWAQLVDPSDGRVTRATPDEVKLGSSTCARIMAQSDSSTRLGPKRLDSDSASGAETQTRSAPMDMAAADADADTQAHFDSYPFRTQTNSNSVGNGPLISLHLARRLSCSTPLPPPLGARRAPHSSPRALFGGRPSGGGVGGGSGGVGPKASERERARTETNPMTTTSAAAAAVARN